MYAFLLEYDCVNIQATLQKPFIGWLLVTACPYTCLDMTLIIVSLFQALSIHYV